MKKILDLNIGWRLLLFGSIICLTACNKEFANLLKDEYANKEIGSSLNKVLLVVVDGVRGDAMADLDPDYMRRIARNSLYSNSSLGDFREQLTFTKETGLTNIFTGVHSVRHQVINDIKALDNASYPTIFERLKANYAGFYGQGYTTHADVSMHLFAGLDEKESLGTDAEVIAKTKQAIAADNTEMVVAHLSAIAEVGQEHSFESDDPAYKAAILKFDAQLEDLISAIEQRPNYKTENWLVVITSSIGGKIADVTQPDQTVYADNLRNTFTYFYSPRFTRKYQPRPSTNALPFVGSGLHLTYGVSGNNATSAQLDDVSKMNFNATQNFTINFFFKQNTFDTNHNYPPILMKRNRTDNGVGWQFIMSGGKVEFGASGIGKIASSSVKDAKWHAITVSVNRAENTAKIYTDGLLSNQTTAGNINITNTIPMVWGKKEGDGGNTGDFTVCNLQVYNIAMSDQEVKQNAGLVIVSPQKSVFYTNLLGYWPTYPDNGTRVITDVTAKAGNLKVVNELKWASFDEYVPFFKPEITEGTFRLVPNQVDIALFIYQWYGVLPKPIWNLDGIAWIPPYSVLTY